MPGSFEDFAAKYDPAIAALLSDCRRRLHRLIPRGHELVYDNYNALVCGFGPSLKASEAVVSLAAYPRWVTLFFLQGALLPDPHGLLQGSGSRVRSIRLRAVEDLDMPEIADLFSHALGTCAESFAAAPAMTTTIKSVSTQQRARRPPKRRPLNPAVD